MRLIIMIRADLSIPILISVNHDNQSNQRSILILSQSSKMSLAIF